MIHLKLKEPTFKNSTSFDITDKNSQVTAMTILKFANSIDPDEVAHDELPHLDLYCLPSYL